MSLNFIYIPKCLPKESSAAQLRHESRQCGVTSLPLRWDSSLSACRVRVEKRYGPQHCSYVSDKSAATLCFGVSESVVMAYNTKKYHLSDLSTGSPAIKWLHNRDKTWKGGGHSVTSALHNQDIECAIYSIGKLEKRFQNEILEFIVKVWNCQI